VNLGNVLDISWGFGRVLRKRSRSLTVPALRLPNPYPSDLSEKF
jgi:hypothetical protein